MAIQINNNSVIRLVVRRGSDTDRQSATLAQGELAYTVDTQRLFVGIDGQVGTGVVAGNKFLGSVANRNSVSTIAQPGDTVYDTSSNSLYAMGSDGVTWSSISPALYNLEYSANGTRIQSTVAGLGFDLGYTTQTTNNILSALGSLQLNYNYWALSGSQLYVGNINNNIFNNTGARLVADAPVYINGSNSQIQLISNNTGQTINFVNSGSTNFNITTLSATSAFRFYTNASVASSAPGYDFNGGCAVFRSGLYVLGSATFQNPPTLVTSSQLGLSTLKLDSSLSLPSVSALLIVNNAGSPSYTMVDVNTNGHDSFYIDSSPFVGIHTTHKSYYPTTFSTVISGNTLNTGNVTVSSGSLTVVGDISAAGDIIGFYSSDIALKQNINPISNALNKLLSLKGVEFDWNNNSIYKGHDVGVLAQDVEEIIPSAVGRRHDGYKGVQYDKIIPLIIEAIRELKSSK